MFEKEIALTVKTYEDSLNSYLEPDYKDRLKKFNMWPEDEDEQRDLREALYLEVKKRNAYNQMESRLADEILNLVMNDILPSIDLANDDMTNKFIDFINNTKKKETNNMNFSKKEI